jgi:hypothetical protein
MHPEDRLERLVRHARDGWRRIRASAAERAAVSQWLAEHPSSWRAVDELWEEALHHRGPLASWLDAGGEPATWTGEIPLHSVLASHPFACLSPWSIQAKSSRS